MLSKNFLIGAKCPRDQACTFRSRMAEISHNKRSGSEDSQVQIGPLLYMQTHYAQRIVLRFASRRDATKFFPEASSAVGELDVIEGTLVYDNKCYGDWDIFYIAREFCRTTA